jgi:hypothetical protein
MQQLFINICNTTCFDPNGSSSGAASLKFQFQMLLGACVHTHAGNAIIKASKTNSTEQNPF